MKKKRLIALGAIFLATILALAAYRQHGAGAGPADTTGSRPVQNERAAAKPTPQSQPEAVEGLAQNYVTPFELYEMRPQGDGPSSDLGLKEGSGTSVREHARSREELEKAAATGDGQACFTLAELYEKGEGVSPDPEKARELFAKACGAGFQKACVEYRRRTGQGG